MSDTRRRSLELIDKANETLDRCAIRAATRPLGEPDALEAWQALMPPAKPAPPEPQRQETRMSGAELKTMALRADYERTCRDVARLEREATAYRNGLEKALGKVIADQRKAIDKLQSQIDELRGDTRIRLVGGRDG